MIFLFLLLVAAAVAVEAWFFMIAIGMIHYEWLTMMPTIGYGPSIVVVIALSLLSLPSILFQANKS